MVKAQIDFGSAIPQPPFGTVENPVNMMKHEHTVEGERLRKIAELTDEYTPPADACNTYRVTFSMLQDFENDLHKHIHLENNILFPKAIKLEKRISVKYNIKIEYMTPKKLWIWLTAVILGSFAVLFFYGVEIYRKIPPVPDKIVTTDGTIIATGQDIKDGQNVWQSIGDRPLEVYGTRSIHRA